jgi:hypothetical protein
VCATCHITATLEWGISKKHSQLNNGESLPNCMGCHGQSLKHQADEQHLVKPDRFARGAAAITALCSECHSDGCSVTGEKADCQTCHHPHAMVSPTSSSEPLVKRAAPLSASFEKYRVKMDEAEKLLKERKLPAAREAFDAALKENPDSQRAPSAIRLIDQRIKQGGDDRGSSAAPPTTQSAGAGRSQ